MIDKIGLLYSLSLSKQEFKEYPNGYSFLAIKTLDSFHLRSRIRPNMFRDRAAILMEAKAKRLPSSATSVVGFGLVSVEGQEKEIR